jgi:hypothetical protein
MTDILKNRSAFILCFKMSGTMDPVVQLQFQTTRIFRLSEPFVFSFIRLRYGVKAQSMLLVLITPGLATANKMCVT